MEYNDLNDEQKAQVDQRVESEYVNSDRDPLKELRAGAEAGTNPESHYYDDVSDDSEIAALQAQTQKVMQRGQSAAPQRPKAERWYLSPGQKPLDRSDPALGGDTPITDAGPSKTADGKSFEEQKSTQMMRAMSSGDVNLYSQLANYNRMTLEQRKRRKAQRNYLMADTLRQGLEQLNGGGGDLRTSKDGKTYRVVMYRNDGEDNPVARLNKLNTYMGKKGTMTSLAVAVEVDRDGKAIGKPILKYGYNDDGGTKASGFRDVNIAEVMNRWADAHAIKNKVSQLEARRTAVQEFGGDKNLAGANPAGWDIAPTAQEIAAEERRKADEKLKLERNKIDNQNAQFYASLGFDRDKLAQTSAQFDKNYDLALKQFDASEKHANAADNIAGRKQDLAEKQFDEQVKQTIRGANRDDMKLAYEIVTGLQSAGKQPTTGEILKAMGDKTLEHFYKIPVRDENGQMVLNADGAPVTREPETKQEYDQCTENLVKAVNALRTTAGAGGIRDRYTQIQQLAQGISSGEAPSAASAVGDMANGVAGLNNGGAGGSNGADKAIMLSDGRAGLVHNGKTYVQVGTDANGNPQWKPIEVPAAPAPVTQANATPQVAQPTQATQNNATAPSPQNDATQADASDQTQTETAAPVATNDELRRKNTSQGAREERESATLEDLWGSEVLDRFRKNHPETTDDDIRSGKFDNALEKIGSALHGGEYKSKNASLKDKERRLRIREDEAARQEAAARKRQEHIAAMDEQKRQIAQKAEDLFGDVWRQADDWAIEHHGEGVFFKDSYETARAKKFAELAKEKAKREGIQLYNIYKLGNNAFGSYDVGNVFDTVFGKGAGTYFGRPKSGASEMFDKKQS